MAVSGSSNRLAQAGFFFSLGSLVLSALDYVIAPVEVSFILDVIFVYSITVASIAGAVLSARGLRRKGSRQRALAAVGLILGTLVFFLYSGRILLVLS